MLYGNLTLLWNISSFFSLPSLLHSGIVKNNSCGRDLKDQVQLHDNCKAHKKLKHVLQGTVQISVEHRQARGITHLAGKPVPVFEHPYGKEMSPNLQCEPHWCSFLLFLYILLFVSSKKRPTLPSPLALLVKLQGAMRSSQPSLLQTT